MVAISLYRGNLHRVPDTPRQWPFPRPSLSVSQFKRLLRKRSLALSRLATSAGASHCSGVAENRPKEEDQASRQGFGAVPVKIESGVHADPRSKREEALPDGKLVKEEGQANDTSAPNSASGSAIAIVNGSEIRPSGAENVKSEANDSKNVFNDKEERKRELEKKLHSLNEKKHNLVQMLKQILQTEEEMKRRNMQQAVIRASMPLQSDNALDINSAARQTPNISVNVNLGGDFGGEPDVASNHNTHGRQLHNVHNTSLSAASLTRSPFGNMSPSAAGLILSPLGSTSPSAASLSRSPFGSLHHSTVHTLRNQATLAHGQTSSSLLGSAPSPARYAATGSQSLAASLPPLLPLPGTSLVASVPSPAGSGGVSLAFKDPRPTNSS